MDELIACVDYEPKYEQIWCIDHYVKIKVEDKDKLDFTLSDKAFREHIYKLEVVE
jgi:hypothetical protein